MLGLEQGEVVDPGAGRRRRGLGLGAGVDVAPDPVRDSAAEGAAGVAHLDRPEGEGVEEELDRAPAKGGVDLVAVAAQGDGGGLSHLPALAPEEGLPQLGRAGVAGRPSGLEARKRRLARLAVGLAVVDAFEPGLELPNPSNVVS